jgi:hypothetical protein
MTEEKFKEAFELTQKISRLKKELEVVRNITPTTIRFGGNFNVSMPIEVEQSIFYDFCRALVDDIQMELSLSELKFDSL